MQFDENGNQISGPIAKFANMPTAPLLTQNIHVPENWIVEVVRSVYDLDNIRLENVDSVVHRFVCFNFVEILFFLTLQHG